MMSYCRDGVQPIGQSVGPLYGLNLDGLNLGDLRLDDLSRAADILLPFRYPTVAATQHPVSGYS